MHTGHEKAGWKGLIVAGSCFIVPAVIITAFFAWCIRSMGSCHKYNPLFTASNRLLLLLAGLEAEGAAASQEEGLRETGRSKSENESNNLPGRGETQGTYEEKSVKDLIIPNCFNNIMKNAGLLFLVFRNKDYKTLHNETTPHALGYLHALVYA